MPDRSVITVSAHVRMTCAELLFSGKSLQALVRSSVSKTDSECRAKILKNIVLSGGTTMIEGLPDRLQREVTALSPAGADIRCIAPAGRKYSVWKGASDLA